MECKRVESCLRCLAKGDSRRREMVMLTALMSDTTMALVEHGALLGPRQLDMRNSGLVVPADRAYIQSLSKVILKCKQLSNGTACPKRHVTEVQRWSHRSVLSVAVNMPKRFSRNSPP